MISTFINPILAATNPGFFDHSGAPPPGLAGFVAVYGLAGIVLTFVLLFVGYILFGIATVRAGVLPRWAAWLVTIGAALRYVPIPADSDFLNLVNTIGGVLFGIGLFALGWAIWSGKRQGMMAQTQPAST